MNKRKHIKRIYNTIVVVLLVGFLCIVLARFLHLGKQEYTDDAQIMRHIVPVNTRIQGFIKKICFEEYQQVHEGDTLVIIEDTEYKLRLAQAEADLSNALSGSSVTSAGIETAQSNIHVAAAGVKEAKVNMENDEREYTRYQALLARDAVTQQQYDNIRTAYEAAKARYEQIVHQQKSSSLARNEQTRRMGQSEAAIKLAQAEVDLAHLNLSYTIITATSDGVMGRKEIHEGQLVQQGQTLANLIDRREVWVIANYRERQMRHIQEGSLVSVKADAIPGKTFEGKVQSISNATGAAYSLVAQDNATGNFVKVEQRVPVRILITNANEKEMKLLRAGLNVECEVKY